MRQVCADPLNLGGTGMRFHVTLALFAASLLSGCYWQPDRTEILVSTNPPGASCVLSQLGQPIATAGPTPAIAIVDLIASEIGVVCRRPGFEDAAVAVPPPPGARIPGWFPDVRPRIAYATRVDVAMTPKPPGVPR